MVIDEIVDHANDIAGGKAKVHPGQPTSFPEAASVNDEIWQGDLGIVVIEKVPTQYSLIAQPSEQDKQLVPGNTEGAKHCLDSFMGVEIYRHGDWGQNYEGLEGPVLKLKEERTIEHPKHGNVTIPAGFIVQCRYQREWDSELARERRNAD